MKQYFVHVYHVVRSKVSIEAVSQEAALNAADQFIPDIQVAHIPHSQESVFQGHGVVHHTENAEEVTAYLVDEVGDEEYQQTRSYEEDGTPTDSSRTNALKASQRERDTILAALRLWQHLIDGTDGDMEMLFDIANNEREAVDGVPPALASYEIDALCERINS